MAVRPDDVIAGAINVGGSVIRSSWGRRAGTAMAEVQVGMSAVHTLGRG